MQGRDGLDRLLEQPIRCEANGHTLLQLAAAHVTHWRLLAARDCSRLGGPGAKCSWAAHAEHAQDQDTHLSTVRMLSFFLLSFKTHLSVVAFPPATKINLKCCVIIRNTS